jgi:hypothetical protein
MQAKELLHQLLLTKQLLFKSMRSLMYWVDYIYQKQQVALLAVVLISCLTEFKVENNLIASTCKVDDFPKQNGIYNHELFMSNGKY